MVWIRTFLMTGMVAIAGLGSVFAQGAEDFSGLTVSNNGYLTRTFNGSSPAGSDPGANSTWTVNRAQANQVGSPLIISTRNGTAGNIILPVLSNGVGEVKVVFARRYQANTVNAQAQLFWASSSTPTTWNAIATTFTIPTVQDQVDSIVISVGQAGPILLKLENITDPGDNNNSRIGIQRISWSSFGVPLPTVLASFKVAEEQENAILSWETKAEKNASHFNIERSEDGTVFNSIGSVTAINNEHGGSYQFVDKQAQPKAPYYRLKMSDFDGKFTYSNTVKLTKQSQGDINWVSLKANVVTSELGILFSQSPARAGVNIWSAGGKLIWTGTTEEQVLSIGTSTFASGTYIAKVSSELGIATFKFVKQ